MWGFDAVKWIFASQGKLDCQLWLMTSFCRDCAMRAIIVELLKPTILTCTPSYAIDLCRVLQEQGMDPAKAIKTG